MCCSAQSVDPFLKNVCCHWSLMWKDLTSASLFFAQTPILDGRCEKHWVRKRQGSESPGSSTDQQAPSSSWLSGSSSRIELYFWGYLLKLSPKNWFYRGGIWKEYQLFWPQSRRLMSKSRTRDKSILEWNLATYAAQALKLAVFPWGKTTL